MSFRVVAHYKDGQPAYYGLERRGWFQWIPYGRYYSDLTTAIKWCDWHNKPLASPNHTTKVVYPYDETPAGKAHR